MSTRQHFGHHRTPGYVKGQTGRVEHVHGFFPDPEKRAYGDSGLPEQPVYMVSFPQRAIWPDYRGGPQDRVYVDLVEAWLEEAD